MSLPCVAGIEREGEGKLGARFSHAPEIPFPSPPFERPPRRLKFHHVLSLKFHDSPGYPMNERILIKKRFINSRSSYI